MLIGAAIWIVCIFLSERKRPAEDLTYSHRISAYIYVNIVAGRDKMNIVIGSESELQELGSIISLRTYRGKLDRSLNVGIQWLFVPL